ncbi:unnamed protein product [Chrysoparadoxa australica]
MMHRNLSAFDVEVVSAEAVQDEKSFMKLGARRKHVEYHIKVTRLRDGASVTVKKRYSALRALWDDLLREKPAAGKGLAFPPKRPITDSDVEGEFIKGRRVALGTFLRRLFCTHPDLWESARVKSFFELSRISLNGGVYNWETGMGSVPSETRAGDPTRDAASKWNPYTVASQVDAVQREQQVQQKSQGQGNWLGQAQSQQHPGQSQLPVAGQGLWQGSTTDQYSGYTGALGGDRHIYSEYGRESSQGAGGGQGIEKREYQGGVCRVNGSGGGSGGTSSAASAARQGLPKPPNPFGPDPAAMHRLCEMGFDGNSAAAALQASGNSVQAAAELLMNGGVAAPLPQQQQQHQLHYAAAGQPMASAYSPAAPLSQGSGRAANQPPVSSSSAYASSASQRRVQGHRSTGSGGPGTVDV